MYIYKDNIGNVFCNHPLVKFIWFTGYVNNIKGICNMHILFNDNETYKISNDNSDYDFLINKGNEYLNNYKNV